MQVLGMLMYLAPVFIIVALRTKLIKKLWVKIVLTVISVLALAITMALGHTGNELDECEAIKEDAIDIMLDYSDCVEYAVDTVDPDLFFDCGLDLYEIING